MMRGRLARGGTGNAFELQPVVHVVGLFVTALGVIMLLPASVDWVAGHAD